MTDHLKILWSTIISRVHLFMTGIKRDLGILGTESDLNIDQLIKKLDLKIPGPADQIILELDPNSVRCIKCGHAIQDACDISDLQYCKRCMLTTLDNIIKLSGDGTANTNVYNDEDILGGFCE